MTLSNLLRVFVCVAALAAVALVCSCGDNTCQPRDEPDYSRTTPENLINHLAESFDAKRLDWYDECLDDNFKFVLTDRDANSLGLPDTAPWFERSLDTTVVGRMFRDGCVRDLSLSFLRYGDPVDGDEEGTLAVRMITDFLLTIDCGGEPLNFVVRDTYFDFIMAEDPDDEGSWVVRTMTEIPMVPLLGSETSMGTETSTLGQVKSIFLMEPASMRTVDEALLDYAKSIGDKDIETYGDCLDYDHRFIFMEDVADSLHLPPEAPWWTKTEDLEAMSTIFGHAYVSDILFKYDVVSRDTSWTAGRMVIELRVLPDIWLTYELPWEEPVYFRVNDEYMDFKFVSRGCCCGRWTIFSVEEIRLNPDRDKRIGRVLTEPMSWGAIKAWFWH